MVLNDVQNGHTLNEKKSNEMDNNINNMIFIKGDCFS